MRMYVQMYMCTCRHVHVHVHVNVYVYVYDCVQHPLLCQLQFNFLCPEEDCQSLLEHLLHEVPEMRPTAAEALQHPWFDAEHSVSGGYVELHSVLICHMHTYVRT